MWKKVFGRKEIQRKLFEFSYYIEILIAIILSIALIILSAKLVLDIGNKAIWGEEMAAVEYFMGCAMTLAVGVEFVKMLCKHTPSTVIEILLFAIARQMIVEHMGAFDTLIGILSITILFATRKYLFIHSDHLKTSPDKMRIEKIHWKDEKQE